MPNRIFSSFCPVNSRVVTCFVFKVLLFKTWCLFLSVDIQYMLLLQNSIPFWTSGPMTKIMVREPKRFYDLNIPLAKCKNNITAQRILRTYDTYALKANKGLRLGWRSILRKMWVHRCWKVFSMLPQCADRDTKWIFSVDTFTSTKSTHWQNSNKPVTHPKVHISRLKVKFLYEYGMFSFLPGSTSSVWQK